MDSRDRFPNVEEVVETILDRRQAAMHTALPVRVVKDSDGHTVMLQPLVKRVQRMPDGKQQTVDYPPLQDVPVQFAGGGGVTVTHPIKADDEGIVVFSSRSIDAWHQQGGQQPQIDARMHDLSDGFFIPGIRSMPRKIDNVSTTSSQMRSDDGKHVVDLHPTNGVKVSVDGGKHVIEASPQGGIKQTSSMPVAINAPGIAMRGQDGAAATSLDFKGSLNIIGGDVTADGVSLKNHVHTGVQPGGGNSGKPVQ